jgi:iron complex transport system substrate-binding protein
VIPALSRSCDAPSGDEPGRLPYTERESPRRKGSPHGSTRANVPPSADAEVELVKSRVTLSIIIVALAASSCAKTVVVKPPKAFPLEVQAANGAVTIPHSPSRIISLSATATEDLFAVGAGPQVVAVDSYSTYPPNAPTTKLSAFTPNLEAIANYRPDLVVVSDDSNHIVSQLGKIGIPVLVEPAAPNLDNAYAQITQLGQATGHAEQAKSVIAGIKAQIDAIVRSMPHPTRPLTVYHELDQTYYSATSHTFIGQIYTLLGIKNIADKAGRSGDYPQLSAEYIISSNPDLIVLADTVCCGQTAKTVAARSGWSKLKAVKQGAVIAVNDSIASQWGPRIVLFLKAVTAAVKTLQGKSK